MTREQLYKEQAALVGVGIAVMISLVAIPLVWLAMIGSWKQGSGPLLWEESGEPEVPMCVYPQSYEN